MSIPAVVSKMLYPGAAELLSAHDTVEVVGSFETDTSEATNVVGEGFSVARTAASVYSITFAHKYPQMLSATVTIENSSDALLNRTYNLTPYVSSTGVIKLYLLDPTTGAAPVAEDNGPRVNFHFKFRRHNALSPAPYTA